MLPNIKNIQASWLTVGKPKGMVRGRSMTPGATIVVKRRNEEEVEIEVIPPSSPPEPAAVGAPAASGEPEGDEPSEPAAG